MMTLKSLGQRITHYRLARGWTKTELGERIGLSHASIVRLEKGTQNIPVQLLFALAETFDISPQSLLGDQGEAEPAMPLTPSIQHLVQAVRQLNESALEHLTAFVITVHKARGGESMEQRHTIKVDPETLQALRILAAYHGKRLHTIVRELALNALQHAEQERSVQHPEQRA